MRRVQTRSRECRNCNEPAIWLPLGSPQLLRAQIRGLVRAKEATGYPDNVILMVGGINTEAEAIALRAACREAGGTKLRLGVAARSPHGLLELPRIARHVDMAWIDYRSLCAAIYRYPDDLPKVGAEGGPTCMAGLSNVNQRTPAPFYVADTSDRPYQPRTSPQVNPKRLFQLMFGEYPGPGPK